MTWLDVPCNLCGATTLREGYYAYAMKIDNDGIPTTLLACRSCFPSAPTATGSIRSRYERSRNTCLYCGVSCQGRFCSERCSKMHANELRPLEPLSPIGALMKELRTIGSAIPLPPTPSATHVTREIMPENAVGVVQAARTKARAKTLDAHANKIKPFVPTNEMGIVFMFGAIIDRIGWQMAYMDGRYPDAVAVNRDKQSVKVEFEYQASSFVAHGHDPQYCDLVVCWENDRHLSVPVLALSQYYDVKSGEWNFRTLP